eukprot:CAMPEP_0176503676 /NCGR_PEP_ID=MMETSP0200_2-20121128/15500_1 /TAXON_ID=947934 /ORGANISM="Chaetoceros sp., Strain GSL56" /LENGTH=580 /DNA_ID=CAMNT_0017903003 /DNA_START=68 /DNA_END=1810 /DNA_ORIENTATION=-
MVESDDRTPIKCPKKDQDEKSAAAALALLSGSPKPAAPAQASAKSPAHFSDESDGSISDSEVSYTSLNSVLPKPIHAPPTNSMMVDHTYTDYSVISEQSLAFLEEGEDLPTKVSEEEKKKHARRVQKIKSIFGDVGPSKKNSGGVVKPFPEKLIEVLDRTDMESIITWMPHGRAFVVLQPQQLRDIVLPRFFKQTKFMSFTRQLNLWGFKRITKGVDSGAYYHELFLRGRPRLAILMKRQKIKGTGIKLTPNPDTEPDFYKISKKRPLPPVDASAKEDKPLPPLRHNIQNRDFDTMPSKIIEYERMVRRFNNRALHQPYDQQQIYPCSNTSFYPGRQSGVAQGFDMSMNTGQVMNMGMGINSATNSMAPYLPPGSINGGMNSNLNDSLAIQQLLLRQHLQPNVQLTSLFNQGMNNTAAVSTPNEALALQQLLLRQQLNSNSLREAETQNARITAAQQLLSQLNGSTSVPNDNIQIHELKQRLLNAASSLDSFNIMNNFNPDVHMSQLPSNQFVPNVFGQQQQQQYQHNLQNNSNFNAFLNALQNPTDIATSQAHFQQIPRNYGNSNENSHLNNNPNMGSY